ncbi:MAG: hypothetical protein B6D56_06390 [Candidatus Omnitrophica bacterium 4484_70.1]|nr:MAG: hypothetical protein B6D56_06390 [Candidatus Omnitrophica bacterium 4484_70.1]
MRKTELSSLSKERRRTERLTLPLNLLYRIPPSPQWITPLKLEDIGGDGLKLRVKKRIKKGEELELRLEIPQEEFIYVKGEVIWNKRVEVSSQKFEYRVGIRFHKMKYFERKRFVSYLAEKILDEHLTEKGEIK